MKEKEIILSKQYSCKELSILLNRSQSAIGKIAKINNIKLPKSKINKARKYWCNEKFFHKWNKEMAYILGFIYADGNIALSPNSKKPYRLTISVCEKDKDILDKIKKCLNYTGELKLVDSILNNKTYPQYIFRINSYEMCERLYSLGVVNNKSLVLNWPKMLPNEYAHHFARGYFDGDGCFSERSDITKNKIVCILGTEHFLNSLKATFSQIYGKLIGGISKHNKSKAYKYYLHGPSAHKFLEWIYQDSTENTRLNRKYKKFENI